MFAAALALLNGCASLPHNGEVPNCERDGRTLRIKGPTDARLVSCLDTAEDIEIVEITSQGGSVRNAIEAGRKLRATGAAMVIVGYCESSCANYLVPAAANVRIAAGARIVLHGSVDAWALERGTTMELYALQRDFAEENGATPGWLMMRTGEDARSGRDGRFVTSDATDADERGRSRYIIVEPEFLASCLPMVRATWDAPLYTSQITASRDRLRRLAAQGFVLSGSMRCTPVQSYPAQP